MYKILFLSIILGFSAIAAENETGIKITYSNPINLHFKSVDLPGDQVHKFDTPIGSLRVTIDHNYEAQAHNFLSGFPLSSGETKDVDVSTLIAPVSLAHKGLRVSAFFNSHDAKVPAGAAAIAHCENVQLGSNVVFKFEEAGQGQYKLTCQSHHP